MLYALLKAGHLIALFVWIGGMVAVALSLRYPSAAHMTPLRSYDRAVTTPAMLLAWAFGILLAVQGGWFTDLWLSAKLTLVLILSGLHGALAGRLRRAIWETATVSDATARLALPFGLGLMTLIVFLVTTKPL